MTRKTKRTIWTVVALVLASVIGFAGYYVNSIYNQLDQLQKTGEASPFRNIEKVDQAVTPAPPKWEGTEPVNILLMGVDVRGTKKGEIPRSDSMMVVSLDPEQQKIRLFSLLRDTYTEIPGYGANRINTAITHGPNTAMQAASDLLGIPVQYYVYTDFQGFIKLVDAIGGVDFEVEKDMYYTSKADNHEYDINLKEGMQHLDGATALQYVRFRHDALSDYSRSSRQREFLAAVADKMQTTTTIAKLPSILEQVNPYIDTNLAVTDMLKLASLGYQSSFAGSEQVPPMNLLVEERIGGAAVLTIRNSDELKQYVQDLFTTVPASSDGESEQAVESSKENNSGSSSTGTDADTSVTDGDSSSSGREL
ncbi:LCP family protein [Paenibacillus sp. P96]|uniref:LCP family protein n=1 Tax=Paenibacillus zeirhizosphaerae TaxID=2987519 RepID=A0ABT9FU94_9BACL|nr:LCP family protein [Paenibacillus sp. P96]MDP4098317.1 LCP family protein [Paenibacillus sp. P96]